MELLSFLALFALMWLVAWLVAVILLDADITTILYDKFGGDLTKQLGGKVVWITGASTGIGAALAVEAAKTGARLVLTARRKDVLEQVKIKCLDAGRYVDMKPEDVMVLPMDMCDMESHEPAFQKVLEQFGKLSVLINNAGRSQRARWEHTSLSVDRQMFELNVFSVVHLSRVVVPHMLERGCGSIAVVSSVAGKTGVPFSGTYTGSKHAVQGYMESLRTEKCGTGIEVCMLCPGPTFSNLLEVAATETPGESFGGSMAPSDKRMTAERCARLSLVAIAHKLPESWICFFPVLPLLYFSQYLPSISKQLMAFIGPKFLAKVRDSKNSMESEKFKQTKLTQKLRQCAP